MLNSKSEQFRLAEDGQISWQENATNPLPGVPIGVLKKGAHILKPDFDLADVEVLKGVDAAAVRVKVQEWLSGHIKAVLEDLIALEETEELSAEGKGIAFQLYESLGILPREEVESLIAGLDTETRRPVRRKKIKLGPILIFIYSLNKPVAVRLRALLWSLYHGRGLPADVPNDGIVSVAVDAAADKDYYRAIGYPVYGGRAIRVDMLDRLISAVYDSADKGKFSAKHEMAEWLGCSIEGLYLVLEAMGHTKLFDPADVVVEEGAVEVSVEAEIVEAPAEEKPEAVAETAEVKAPAPAVDIKPELAVFRLKKGKANQKAQSSASSASAPKAGKKSAHKKTAKPKRDTGPRVISTGPERKLEDSPFAILGQLKK